MKRNLPYLTGLFKMKSRLPAAAAGLLVALLFFGCQLFRTTEPDPEPAEKVTESGLVYTILREGEGPRPDTGDVVTVHYTGKLMDGTVFESSYEREEPVDIRLGSEQLLPGWDEGIALLREGAKAVFVIPPDLAYGDMGFGPIPENETLTYEVEVLRITSPATLYEEEEDLFREITASGAEYAILEEGDGRPLSEEMLVTVNYTGYLEDQQYVFDSSYERGEPLSFILGRNMVIPGWEEALTHLQVGDKARLWIPYELAYGEEGRGEIPPATDLVFDMEILEASPVAAPDPFPVEGRDTVQTDTGLQYIMVEEGKGDQPSPGNILAVHYSGYLSDGTLFDSSRQRSEPFRFVLGTDQVLRGWDEAFLYLSEGSKVRLIIPPDLAYGDRGYGPIPPGETLIFDVELIEIEQ